MGLQVTIVVSVADVDGHFKTAKEQGAEIVNEPADEFWGARQYRVKDLAGHSWTFSNWGQK